MQPLDNFRYSSGYWNIKSGAGVAALTILAISLIAFGVIQQTHLSSFLPKMPKAISYVSMGAGGASFIAATLISSRLQYKAYWFKKTHPSSSYEETFSGFIENYKEVSIPFANSTPYGDTVLVCQTHPLQAHIFRKEKDGQNFLTNLIKKNYLTPHPIKLI